MAVLLTEEQVQECRARVRAVAERQFATLGLERTSLRSIATELGWGAASLYRYFSSKNELLAAIRASAHDRFADRMEAAFASASDPWDRSRAIGQAYVDFAFDEPHAYQLMFALAQPEEDKTDDLRAAERRSRRTLTAYVEDMVALGLLQGDPRVLGHAYWAAIHGLVVLRMAGKLDPDISFDLLRHEVARLVTRGALPFGAARVPSDGGPVSRDPVFPSPTSTKAPKGTAMQSLPDGAPATLGEAFAQINACESPSLLELQLMVLAEAASKELYAGLAAGAPSEAVRDLLLANGREELAHAHRVSRAIGHLTGTDYPVPSPHENPYLAEPAPDRPVTAEMLAALAQAEYAGDDLYRKWADNCADPEAAELLRQNGREEIGHAERLETAGALMAAA